MKAIFFALSLVLSLVGFNASAQTGNQGMVRYNATTLPGKTFVFPDGHWGWHAVYFRKDGTYKVCGPITAGCDEGTWSINEYGRLVRVNKTWYSSQNYRPTPIFLINENDGRKALFGGLKSEVFEENETLPSQISEDPRK